MTDNDEIERVRQSLRDSLLRAWPALEQIANDSARPERERARAREVMRKYGAEVQRIRDRRDQGLADVPTLAEIFAEAALTPKERVREGDSASSPVD